MRVFARFLSKSKFLEQHYFMALGQINKSTEVGRWIRLLSSLDEVRTIIEIGTWSGRGSSRMIALGVQDSGSESSKHVLGLEIDLAMWKRASRNLKRYRFFEVLHGTVVGIHELDKSNLSEAEVQWLKHGINNLSQAQNVLPKIPAEIDLLILDGGEFSSYAEFLILESRLSGYIVLDDTLVRKNLEVVNKLKMDPKFVLLWESKLRNGCAIFKRCADTHRD